MTTNMKRKCGVGKGRACVVVVSQAFWIVNIIHVRPSTGTPSSLLLSHLFSISGTNGTFLALIRFSSHPVPSRSFRPDEMKLTLTIALMKSKPPNSRPIPFPGGKSPAFEDVQQNLDHAGGCLERSKQEVKPKLVSFDTLLGLWSVEMEDVSIRQCHSTNWISFELSIPGRLLLI